MIKIIVYVTSIIAFTPNFITVSLHTENPKITFFNRTEKEREKAQRGIIFLPGTDIDILFGVLDNLSVPLWVHGPTCRELYRTLPTLIANAEEKYPEDVLQINTKDLIVFQPKEGDAYLLIPTQYLIDCGIDTTSIQSLAPGKNMPDEWGYNLGFNNKILTAIDNTKVAESHGFPRITQKAIPQDIFLSNKNYFTHNKKDLIPEWTIVFEGHGAAGKKICELTIPEFQEILNFAENHITTRLLCYITCFSGGLSEQQTYQGAKSSWLSKTYAYPILVAGWGDEFVGKALSSYTPFFSEAFKLTWDIEKLFNTLDVRRDIDPRNGPQIRFPGMPWFTAVESGKHSIQIGDIRTATCTLNNKPLIIRNLVQKSALTNPNSPLALLLLANNIQCAIDLIGIIGDPVFISMIPGSATHYIKKLILPENFSDLQDTNSLAQKIKSYFFPSLSTDEASYLTDDTIPTKIFLIDEMTFVDPDSNKKDTVPVTINQILISQNDCYYQYQGELYTQTADKKSTEKASEEYAEKYRSLWQQYYQQITDHREGKGGQLHNAMHKISATLEKKLPNISAKQHKPSPRQDSLTQAVSA